MRSRLIAAAALLLAAGPAAAQLVTAEVPALRETQAVASARDAADDPAVWRDPRRPARSLIVATDKKAGLYVYGLDGRTRSRLAAGRVNNVDLRAGVAISGARGVLVAASDRNDPAQARLALFQLDPRTGVLRPLGALPVAGGEAYGVCLWRRPVDGALFAFNVLKDGTIVQARLDLSGERPRLVVVRTLKLATQSEGCVADDRTGRVYVAEEDVGPWRIEADPAGKGPEPFARVDGERLVADAEGVALAPEGERSGYLVISSQGDSAYAVYRLEDGAFAGRFRIVPGPAGVDGTSETDGIEIATGGFGVGLEGGLMVAQDGDNTPDAQNFKLVSWAAVKARLGLP